MCYCCCCYCSANNSVALFFWFQFMLTVANDPTTTTMVVVNGWMGECKMVFLCKIAIDLTYLVFFSSSYYLSLCILRVSNAQVNLYVSSWLTPPSPSPQMLVCMYLTLTQWCISIMKMFQWLFTPSPQLNKWLICVYDFFYTILCCCCRPSLEFVFFSFTHFQRYDTGIYSEKFIRFFLLLCCKCRHKVEKMKRNRLQ